MRAVNLVPADARPGRVNGGKSGGAVYAVIGGLVVLLLGMSVLAVTKRDAAKAEQELAAVQQSTQAYTSAAAKFSSFEQAADQASQRITTVRGLADARFDWAGTLRDMSRLIPAETQILQLSASVSASSGAGSGGGANSMRASIDTPAVSLTGCSKTQSSVANLVNQLQAMRRVTNVTLSSSEQTDSVGGGSSDGASCTLGGTPFNFSLVVFMAPGTAQSSGTVVPQTTTPAATAASATTTDSSAAATTPATSTGGATP